VLVISDFRFKFYNKELYRYENEKDEQHESMCSITGTFIKEELEVIIDRNTILYPFSLYSNNNTRTYYALQKTEQANWVKSIKFVIGYSNLYDYYELGVFFKNI